MPRQRLPLEVAEDEQDLRVAGAWWAISRDKPAARRSDVNVASHLLIDVLTDAVDAAIVFSNDSDLRLPLQQARLRVPVATVNPGRHPTAKALRGQPDDGVGRHWWRRLTPADFVAHQLPDAVGPFTKPLGW